MIEPIYVEEVRYIINPVLKNVMDFDDECQVREELEKEIGIKIISVRKIKIMECFLLEHFKEQKYGIAFKAVILRKLTP